MTVLSEPLVLAAPHGLKALRGKVRVALKSVTRLAADHLSAPHRAGLS